MRLKRPRPAHGRALPVLLAGLALLAALAVPAGPLRAAPPTGQADQAIQASLQDAAFKDFLVFMGQFTGLKPVFREDQLPRAGVSLDCRQGANAAELEAMFALVLDAANLAQTRRGDTLYVLPGPTGPMNPPPGPPGSPRPPAALGEIQTQILAVRLPAGQDPAQVALLLDRLRSDSGVVRASGPARAVVLRDLAERVARARAVLAVLAAAPSGARAEIAPLRHAQAALSTRKLEMHFKGLPGKPPAVLALDWSNSVLLAGNDEQLAQGLKLLAQMDEGGSEALALRAFRLRFARPEQAAAALEPLARAENGMRVRVDAEAGAVVVLAGAEAMDRAERLVAELDRPRPRVLVEAVVAEFPAGLSPAGLTFAQAAAGQAATPSRDGRAFALAQAGEAPRYRGKAAGEAGPIGLADPGDTLGQAGLDGLAALLAADPKIRVLARPRAAVQDGGEMRVSAGNTGQQAAGDRFRLLLTPHLPEPGPDGKDGKDGEGVRLRVSLEDALNPGAPFTAEARLGKGAVLLLVSGGALPAAAQDSGWTLLSGSSKAAAPARLVIALCARVARPPAPPSAQAPANP
jgi:type II secretory pathway component GspD/PulD (secretin)